MMRLRRGQRVVLLALLLFVATTALFAFRRQRVAYGQFGQDIWIMTEVFPALTDGYYVDIGAGDAVIGSNTKALEELGWNGIAVEPFPTGWEKRRAQLFREVVSSEKGKEVEFAVIRGLGGIVDYLGRWEDDSQVKNARRQKFITTTIAEILERAHAPSFIHYVSLDVEGAEYEVLKAFPFEKHRVGAWTIEHNQESQKRAAIRRLLEQHGFKVVKELEFEDWFVNLP